MTKIPDTCTPALQAAGCNYDPIKDRLRQTVRATIEELFEEEFEAFIGRCRYGRDGATKKGYRHGHRDRQLAGTFGTETVRVPRASNRLHEISERHQSTPLAARSNPGIN